MESKLAMLTTQSWLVFIPLHKGATSRGNTTPEEMKLFLNTFRTSLPLFPDTHRGCFLPWACDQQAFQKPLYSLAHPV